MFGKKSLTKIVFSLVLILGFSLASCTSGTTTPEDAQTNDAAQTLRIALLMPEDATFFKTIEEGASEAANRLKAELIIREAQNDLATQNEQIQEMIDQGVDAIVITAVDGAGVADKINAAAAAGIAVLSVDRSIESDAIISHIASDNMAGGKMAGDYLAELLGDEGDVVELEGIEGTSAAQERGAGFNEAIAAYPNITVVAKEVANFNRQEGHDVFAQILADNPKIVGVFAHNDEMILGAIAAAEEAGRLRDIRFMGFDAVDDAIAALEAGSLAGTIAQQPAEMGRLGIENAVKHLQGETIPKTIAVDLALVTH